MDKINILMLGGKRCGKTTVLAAMCNEINKALAGTNMELGFMNESTRENLNRARDVIQNKLKIFEQPLTRIVMDDNPTNAQKTYSFKLIVNGRNGGIPFELHDIPGEWLTDQHQEAVKKLVHDCQVIIIAIDTPYLFAKMTDKGYGIYHEEYNKPLEIANFFKNSLSINDIRDRMILFVPLKCERYYHLTHTPQLNVFKRNYMRELVSAVSSGYRELLLYLRSTRELVNCCTIAILPILSAGGIDFVNFQKDPETGTVVSYYQEPEFLPESERGYCPRFCEQPMVYSLAYILAQTLDNLQKHNVLYLFGTNLFRGLNKNQMQAALDTMQKKMMRNSGLHSEEGFFIIQNPKNL